MHFKYLAMVALVLLVSVGAATVSHSYERTAPGRTDAPAALLPTAGRVSTTMAADLPLRENAAVEKYLKKYTEGAGLKATRVGFERAQNKVAVAERIFVEEGVPAELVWLAQVESLWKIQAVSPAAAAGVWQFIPKTAVRFGLRADAERDDRYDFERQTRVAARYLRFLYEYFDGNWELAIGAYNTGEENMDRAIQRAGGVRDFWVLREKNLLHPETAEYVPKVLAASILGSDPARFGLEAYAPRRAD